jgi:hypothetical protein
MMTFPVTLLTTIMATTSFFDLSDTLVKDSTIQLRQLENGTLSCVRENATPEQKASMRIVVERKPEQVMWIDDLALDEVESFLTSCQVQMQHAPEIVIAVGDFPKQEMEQRIAHHFASLPRTQPLSPPSSLNTVADLRRAWVASLMAEHEGPLAEEELINVKGIARDNLVVLASETESSSRLASYYMDDFLHGRGWIDLEHYLVTSPQLIESISLQDFNQPVLSSPAVSPSVQQPAAVIDPFEALPLSAEEEKIISRIFITMAEKNVVQLLFEKKDLEKKGKRINPVHPLRLLCYLFSDPYLKRCMNIVRKSHFKWDSFVSGLSRRLKEEAGNDNLAKHVPSFSKKLNVDPNQVMKYIQNRDWEGLARFLL